MNVYHKSKFTGIEIDQRLAQGTYDDAVKAGFTGTKEEFDQLTWAFGKEQQELLKTAQQQRADNLETESKNIVEAINEVYHKADNSQVLEELSQKQNIQDDNLQTSNKTIVSAINEIKESVDSISDPYEINLTNLLSAEDSESISTAIGGIDNLNATVQDNRIIVGTISNGSVSVSIRILGNVTTLYYLLDSVVGLTLNEIAITNTSGTLSKSITTHSVLTENMVINSLESDENTLPLSAAQGKVLATDKQSKTDNTLDTASKTIVGAINEILPKATGVGKVDPNSNGTGEIFNSYEGNDDPSGDVGVNEASGSYSHAEGSKTSATGRMAHAEGNGTKASGSGSHAEGYFSRALDGYSHAEGAMTEASGAYSHAEGFSTEASGKTSHAQGNETIAQNSYEHAEGSYNVSNTGDTEDLQTRHSVGIGTSSSNRKNAHEIMTNGDHYVYGLGNFDGTNSADAQTLQEVINSKQATITAGTGLEFEGTTLNVTLDTTVFKVVSVLPDSPAQGDENKIHLVPAESVGANNAYTEYVWVNSTWEILGEYTSEVDLTPYLKIETAANTYLSKTDATSTYLSKTDASSTYLNKTDAASAYQPVGDYATTTQLEALQTEVNSKADSTELPSYTTVPTLTADYTIPANGTSREYIYEISVGETTYNITAESEVAWIGGVAPVVQANHKYIVSVINNIAVWGEV